MSRISNFNGFESLFRSLGQPAGAEPRSVAQNQPAPAREAAAVEEISVQLEAVRAQVLYERESFRAVAAGLPSQADLGVDLRQAAVSSGLEATGPQVDPTLTPEEALFEQLDPKLAKGIKALRELVAKFSPGATEDLDRLISKVARFANEAHGTGGGSPAPAGQTRAERLSFAIEESVIELNVRLADGTELNTRVVSRTLIANFEQTLGQSDPLVLDLNGNGQFDVTEAAGGHQFDILGNGSPVQVATATAGDAFLAYDRNDNGQIDDGTELFGDQNGAAHGFAELARYDSNSDGAIDKQDTVFDRLSVFADTNRNGRTDSGELRSLQQAGISRLLLNAAGTNESVRGNRVILASSFERSDGSVGRLGDLLLNYVG